MLRVVMVAEPELVARLAPELAYEGLQVLGMLEPAAMAAWVDAGGRAGDGDPGAVLSVADVVLVAADGAGSAGLLGPALRVACDGRGIRVVVLVANDEERRRAHASGFDCTAAAATPAEVVNAIRGLGEGLVPPEPPSRGRIVTVWGPGGAPGRSTIAIELAYELARGGRSVALVDADTQGASLALALGLPDEGPGFAAACRAAAAGLLDAEELERISLPLPHREGSLRVLTGLNRPSRWPELREERVAEALRICRDWVDFVVVDVAAPLERDEEIVSDLDGPRRHAAGFGALRAADQVVAVASTEPLGIARFVRGLAELRALVGETPVAVLVNRLRPGALGVDARGQVRATLLRFAGVPDVTFVPLDPRAVDAAMLAAEPVGARLPNAPLVAALRRFVGATLAPANVPARGTRHAREARRAGEPEIGTPRAKRRRLRRTATQHAESGTVAI